MTNENTSQFNCIERKASKFQDRPTAFFNLKETSPNQTQPKPT